MATTAELTKELDALFGSWAPEERAAVVTAHQATLPGMQRYRLHSVGPLGKPLWSMSLEEQKQVLASTPALRGFKPMRIPKRCKRRLRPG